jgi:hypothetical protein
MSDAPSEEDSPDPMDIHGMRLQARNDSRDKQTRNSLNKLMRSHNNSSVKDLLEEANEEIKSNNYLQG